MATRLTKRYPGGTMALDAVDLQVGHGEVFGLLGPNGAGKSTFIRILLDMIRPTAGRAAVLGHDTQADSVGARGAIGYLPGNPRFPARMTAWDLFGFVGDIRGLNGDAAMTLVSVGLAFVIEVLGLESIDLRRPWRPLASVLIASLCFALLALTAGNDWLRSFFAFTPSPFSPGRWW